MTNETLAHISRIIVISAVALVLVWDIVVLFLSKKKGDLTTSVSYAIWGFARRAPFVPFIVGFICGHLFWGDPNTSILWIDSPPPCE